ncbi:glycoside hydrolase superfamily [Lactarius quietus]|nr:glycoside hydrolase superfamily [Lactarius quietus]
MRSLLQNIALATLSLLGVTTEPQPVVVKQATLRDAIVHRPLLQPNYIGATNNKIIRGAYHFAHPGTSTGAAQADYFLAHGGGWSADGITLPGALDLEGDCSNLSAAEMVSWIKDFSNTYHSKTKRYPVIYTTTSWWKGCTGNSKHSALTTHSGSPPGQAPLAPSPLAGVANVIHSYTTFWQYADSGPFPGDQDLFNGDAAGLKR